MFHNIEYKHYILILTSILIAGTISFVILYQDHPETIPDKTSEEVDLLFFIL